MAIGVARDGGKKLSVSDEQGGLSTFCPESIERELDRILASDIFSHSKRLSRFLRYIVHQAIQGATDKLKEYVIGIEVFDRHQLFDQRTDPIVRVEAGRLRLKLKQYYRSAGRDDEIRIECAKGGYMPVFHKQEPALLKRRPRRQRARKEPAIAVLPFADLSPAQDQEYFCAGITEELVGILTRVEGIRVTSRTSAAAFRKKTEDIREIGRLLNVNAILEGSVRKQGDRLRITAQLTDVADGFQLWSETHERASRDLFVIQDEISRSIVENLRIKLLGHKIILERNTD